MTNLANKIHTPHFLRKEKKLEKGTIKSKPTDHYILKAITQVHLPMASHLLLSSVALWICGHLFRFFLTFNGTVIDFNDFHI